MPGWTRGITAIKSAAVAAAAAAAVLAPAAGAYGATNPQWIPLQTAHGVGVYTFTDAGSSKIGPPLWQSEGASVIADCWIAGGQVYNDGNVWYHVPWIWRGTQSPDGNTQFVSAWVFGPYVDGAAAFHNHTLPNCSN